LLLALAVFWIGIKNRSTGNRYRILVLAGGCCVVKFLFPFLSLIVKLARWAKAVKGGRLRLPFIGASEASEDP